MLTGSMYLSDIQDRSRRAPDRGAALRLERRARVAAAVAAPTLATAQGTPIARYGTFETDIETVKAGDAFSGRNRVSSNSSNFGIRGFEDIDGRARFCSGIRHLQS